MGNRILKESICTSKEIDALSWFEETLFYRLIVNVDDYGVFQADPVLLAHVLFPRKENVTRKMVAEALNRMEEIRLLRRYQVHGDAFLLLESWARHQRLRSSIRKYPAPEEADAEKSGAPIEPESPPPKEAEPDVPKAEELPVITLPLNDGSEFPVSREDADEYASLYPAVDVPQELRSIRGWLLSNKQKQKTRAGIRRFVNSWMARAQDRGKPAPPPGRVPPLNNNPYMMAYEGAVE